MKSTDPAEVRNSGISGTARVAASNMENRNTLSSMFFFEAMPFRGMNSWLCNAPILHGRHCKSVSQMTIIHQKLSG